MSAAVSWRPTDPQTVLACTLWMEARSDGKEGMQGVASVILNRAHDPSWWGHDVASVCLDPEQFSCWNEGSTQVPLVRHAMLSGDEDYALALNLAGLAVDGILPDNTGRADSYYALSRATPPTWATPARFTVQIGDQRFFRVQIP